MTSFVGLDVSLKETSVCIIDQEGNVTARGTTETDPALIQKFILNHTDGIEKVVHESGQLSIWLHRELEKLNLPVICVDARSAHKALSARMNKSDRADAEGLAQLARTGWYRETHIKSDNSDRLRHLIGARKRLVKLRQDIEGHVRGVLKTFGIRLTSIAPGYHRASFRKQVREAADSEPLVQALVDAFLGPHEVICKKCSEIENQLVRIAKENEIAQRLMTVPGVGPLVALSFIAVIDDEARFSKSTNVAAYLGLTPKRYQSGDVDYTGRISKRGDGEMRSLLYEAASVLICRVKRFSSLKNWAVRLTARKGFKKAATATARKLAVILHRIWRDGTTFNWSGEADAR